MFILYLVDHIGHPPWDHCMALELRCFVSVISFYEMNSNMLHIITVKEPTSICASFFIAYFKALPYIY